MRGARLCVPYTTALSRARSPRATAVASRIDMVDFVCRPLNPWSPGRLERCGVLIISTPKVAQTVPKLGRFEGLRRFLLGAPLVGVSVNGREVRVSDEFSTALLLLKSEDYCIVGQLLRPCCF